MTDDRKSGIALIAGSLGAILTMALHPTPSASLSAEQVSRLMAGSGIAHALGMVSILLLFLGACGLTMRIAAADRFSFAAIVTFGFACVAVLIATAVSGFVVPAIMKHMVGDIPSAGRQWQIVMAGIFEINQAFSRIYSVAAGVAIILWSISAMRNGGFGRGVATYGCVVSALIVVAIGMGHLRLDVHGMAVVVLGQVIWFIAVGYRLCSPSASSVSPP
jgi:hypothetical protein